MNAASRRLFDEFLEQELSALPDHLLELLDEVPLIVEDEPSRQLLREMGMEPDEELFGLHDGVALTERSVEQAPAAPDRMMMFRGPIMRLAGDDLDELREQIHVTLLHEIGHHFGLDEDQLDNLGYG